MAAASTIGLNAEYLHGDDDILDAGKAETIRSAKRPVAEHNVSEAFEGMPASKRERQAQRYREVGDSKLAAFLYSEAARQYTLAIADDETDAEALAGRSACSSATGQLAEAIADARACVALRPTWPRGYLKLGAALSMSKDLDAAEEAYERGRRCFMDGDADDPGAPRSTTGQPREAHEQGDATWKALQGALVRLRAEKRDTVLGELERSNGCEARWLFGG